VKFGIAAAASASGRNASSTPYLLGPSEEKKLVG